MQQPEPATPTTRSPSSSPSILASFSMPYMNSRLLPYRPRAQQDNRRAVTAAAQAAIAAVAAVSGGSTTPIPPSIHPQFRSKTVCRLYCQHCSSNLCQRGMRAILLGNVNVELFSTDIPPQGVQLVFNDYLTKNCA